MSSTAGNIKLLFKDNLMNWFTKLQYKKPSKKCVSPFCGLAKHTIFCRVQALLQWNEHSRSQLPGRSKADHNQESDSPACFLFFPLLLTRSAVRGADWAWQLHSTLLQTHLPAPHRSSGLFPCLLVALRILTRPDQGLQGPLTALWCWDKPAPERFYQLKFTLSLQTKKKPMSNSLFIATSC